MEEEEEKNDYSHSLNMQYNADCLNKIRKSIDDQARSKYENLVPGQKEMIRPQSYNEQHRQIENRGQEQGAQKIEGSNSEINYKPIMTNDINIGENFSSNFGNNVFTQ